MLTNKIQDIFQAFMKNDPVVETHTNRFIVGAQVDNELFYATDANHPAYPWWTKNPWEAMPFNTQDEADVYLKREIRLGRVNWLAKSEARYHASVFHTIFNSAILTNLGPIVFFICEQETKLPAFTMKMNEQDS